MPRASRATGRKPEPSTGPRGALDAAAHVAATATAVRRGVAAGLPLLIDHLARTTGHGPASRAPIASPLGTLSTSWTREETAPLVRRAIAACDGTGGDAFRHACAAEAALAVLDIHPGGRSAYVSSRIADDAAAGRGVLAGHDAATVTDGVRDAFAALTSTSDDRPADDGIGGPRGRPLRPSDIRTIPGTFRRHGARTDAHLAIDLAVMQGLDRVAAHMRTATGRGLVPVEDSENRAGTIARSWTSDELSPLGRGARTVVERHARSPFRRACAERAAAVIGCMCPDMGLRAPRAGTALSAHLNEVEKAIVGLGATRAGDGVRWAFDAILDEARGHDVAGERIGQPRGIADRAARLASWMAAGDTGASSETLASALMRRTLGEAPDPGADRSLPADADDFGRCVRMVDALGARSAEITRTTAAMGPGWAAIGGMWDDLRAQHAAGRHDAVRMGLRAIGLATRRA